MSDQYGSPPIPADWYSDPQDSNRVRWWNGNAWTDITKTDPRKLDIIESAQPFSFTESPVFVPAVAHTGPVTHSPEWDDAVQNPFYGTYTPMGASAEVRAAYDDTRAKYARYGSSTVAIWFMVFWPIVNSAVVIAIFLLFLPGIALAAKSVNYSSADVVGSLFFIGAGDLIAMAITQLLLASSDANALRRRGYDPPSPWWILIPLVYMIIRTIRTGPSGILFLLLWIAVPTLTYGVEYLVRAGVLRL